VRRLLSTGQPAGAAAPADGAGGSDSAAFFDLDRAWRLHPRVSVRPESFGALVYHFGTRRLSFLKTPQLVDVVSGLEHHADAHGAVEAAGVAQPQRPAYLRALAGLAANGTIEER